MEGMGNLSESLIVIMGICTSKRQICPAGQDSILVVSSVRTKVPRLEPITHSTLAKSRVSRRSSVSSEVVSVLSSPVEDPTVSLSY